MKTLLLLPLLLVLLTSGQNPPASNDASQVVVLSYKWSKTRQTIESDSSAPAAPAAAMTAADKNFERNRRANAPVGEKDPREDTIDGRSAALERSVQKSRTDPKPIDGYAYRTKIQNASNKVIEVVFWEYQFKESANPSALSRRQFLCGVNIKPAKEKELVAFSASRPSDVISVDGLANKSGNLFQENVVINRVEYADGSIWQRKDWNFAEIRLSYKRAISTPWGAEMCRGL